METLGQFLKREREFRGVSLDDLAQTTKISRRFLLGLEEDRWENLPRGAFARGFLKSYASQLGIPMDEVLKRYQSVQTPEKSEYNPFQKFRGFEVKNQFFLLLVAAVVVIILAAFLSSR